MLSGVLGRTRWHPQIYLANEKGGNPEQYYWIRQGPIAFGGFCNLVMVLVCLAQLNYDARKYHLPMFLHLRAIFKGGAAPLPHTLDIREGLVEEVDYEVRADSVSGTAVGVNLNQRCCG